MVSLKHLTARILEVKLDYPEGYAASIADDFIRDDFPKNGIRTPGQAIAYLDEVVERVKAARTARGEAR